MFELRRLRLLHELSLRGTLAAVADALSYSPSTISQQLAQLERDAGIALLVPDGRRVRLTEQGAALAAHAARALDADEAVRRRDPDFLLMLRSPGKGSKLSVPRDPQQALQRVPALSGALLLMPRALFDRIGGWDAGYRLHAEDLDLCRRAREAGAVVAIANDLQVTHVRGVSSRSRPFFVEWHKHRGLWRYFQKFEASQRSLPVRAAVWGAIWAHALMLVPRLVRRSL